MTFRRTSAESPDDVIELDLELRPLGAPGGAPHRHTPVERFEITDGALCVWIAPHLPRLVRAGSVVEIPSRRPHFLLALGRSRARVLIRPAMRFDELLVDMAELGSGKLDLGLVRRIAPLLRQHGFL